LQVRNELLYTIWGKKIFKTFHNFIFKNKNVFLNCSYKTSINEFTIVSLILGQLYVTYKWWIVVRWRFWWWHNCIHDSMLCILCCTDTVCTWTSSFEFVEWVSKGVALLNLARGINNFLLFEYALNLTSGRKKLYTINKSVNQDSWIRFYPIGNLIVVDLFFIQILYFS
jgi:hypothetical protein